MVQSSTNTSLQFASYSRYGICEALEPTPGGCGGKAPGRFTIHGLLSEVDTPGEFFWDATSRVLYIYPLTDSYAQSKVRLGFWAGPGLLSLKNSEWVTLRDVTVTGSTGTGVSITGGKFNTVGGCTIKSSAGGISLTGGHHNQVLGNDIYDVNSHITSDGNPGEGLDNLIPTNNLIANNHLTQLHLTTAAWQIRIRGLGDRFKNNLVPTRLFVVSIDDLWPCVAGPRRSWSGHFARGSIESL